MTFGQLLVVERRATEWRDDAEKRDVDTERLEARGGPDDPVRALIVEAGDKARHHTDSAIVEARDRIGVLRGSVLSLVAAREIGVVEALDAKEDADAAGPLHRVEQRAVTHDVEGNLREPGAAHAGHRGEQLLRPPPFHEQLVVPEPGDVFTPSAR